MRSRSEDVPASISVFSEETLTRMNVVNFADFADAVPGITYATTGLGNSQYFIRGVGQVGGNQAPTTGVYLDEIPAKPFAGRQLTARTRSSTTSRASRCFEAHKA